MKMWPKAGMCAAGVVMAVVIGITVWCAGLFRKSPDYAATGVCTESEIDKTYAAIDKAGAFREISMLRVHYEFRAFHLHVRTLRVALERAANGLAYETLGKRKTAAYQCNDATRNVLGVTAHTLPKLAVSMRTLEKDEYTRWRLALCMVAKARNIESAASFDGLKTGCKLWPWKPQRH